MSTIVSILIAVLVFGIVILFHEFGHFITAKWSGVQVNEFSIGMGPALVKKIWGGTQYSIRLLPIGGYVAMEGEDSPESSRTSVPQDEDFTNDDFVDEGEDCSPARPAQCSGIPFDKAKLWKRLVIIVAGAFMNFVLGFLVLLAFVGMDDSIITLKIHNFDEGALCAETGLQAEDEIIAINGRRCFVPEDLSYELSRTPNYSADFTVLRDGKKVQLNDVRFNTITDEEGNIYMPPQIVVYAVPRTPMGVIRQAANYEIYYSRVVFTTLMDLARGRESINNLSGPVGIVSAIEQAVSVDWSAVLSLLALITINLGIFNLLPLPALDGGKVIFLLIEGVTRRPVPAKVQEVVNLIGFALLFGLMIFVTGNDLIRLFF